MSFDELAELSEGWVWAKLGELGLFINGDRGKNYPNKNALVESGIPFINAGHIQDGIIKLSEMNYITEERFNLLGSGKVKPNDILYCLRGSLGKTAIVKNITKGAIASSLVIIRPCDSSKHEYLFYYLISPFGDAEIRKYDNGSAQPNLSAQSVKSYSIPLPPLNEQRRIVAKIEALKVRSQRVKKALEDARQLENTLVAYYTTGWTEGELDSHIEERNELAGEYWQKYPLVGLSNEGRITERREPIGQKTAHRCKVVHPGDIVFNPIRFSIGSIARYRGDETVIVSSEYQVFRTKSTMSAELVCRYLRSKPGQSRLEIETQGSVRYRVYLRNLQRLAMPIAPPERQVEAEKFFLCLNKTFEIVEQAINAIPLLEQSILAKAFRGELVPQDPNDEPASVLLERIRAESDKLQTKAVS